MIINNNFINQVQNLIIKMYDDLNLAKQSFQFIPSQAFLFNPSNNNMNIQQRCQQQIVDDDYLFKTSNNQLKRRIYEGSTKYSKFQNQKLYQFQEYIKKKSIIIDQRWTKCWRLRWLQSVDYDVRKCLEDMDVFISYQNRNRNIVITPNIQRLLKLGIYYIAGRDSHFRPILVLDVKKMSSSNINQQQFAICQIYFFQFLMREMLIPGKVQNWVTIIDVGYQGVMSMVGSMKKSISFLQSTYRQRMYVAYIVRPSSTCLFLWNIAENFLHADTKKKVVFVKNDTIDQLLQYCHPSQLQKKFGGTLPDLTSHWPVRLHSPNYLGKESIELLSPQQYGKNHMLYPFIQTKIYIPYTIQQKRQLVQQMKQKQIKSNQLNDLQINKRLESFRQVGVKDLSLINIKTKNLNQDQGRKWVWKHDGVKHDKLNNI